MSELLSKLRHATATFLARREHSRFELQHKLLRHCDDPSLILQVITEYSEKNLQSDERFAESYVYSRQLRGYGPLRIRAELANRGVEERIIDRMVEERASIYDDVIKEVYRKKYGGSVWLDIPEKAKRMRFLQQRGFTHEQIKKQVG